MSTRSADILRADVSGNVILPDGSKAPAAIAHALGYIVLNAADVVAEVEARRARTAGAPRAAPAASTALVPVAPASPPAVVAPPAPSPAEAHRAAILALPEAGGKASSAEYLASTGMPLDRAARFLAGAPFDAGAAR